MVALADVSRATAQLARYVVPQRCNAPASCHAANGYRACPDHAIPETATACAAGTCDYPMDGLGAARISKPRC